MTTKHKTRDVEAPQTIRSDRYLSVYANNARIQMSAFDVRLVFGEVSAVGDAQQIEQTVSIVMSLHHAKVFAQILSENLAHYEQQVGELRLPEVKPDRLSPIK